MDRILMPLVPDAANALGVGKTKAFELAASGALPTVSLGRKRMVHVDDLRRFAESLREHSQPVAAG